MSTRYMVLYLIGSLRNPEVPEVAKRLRRPYLSIFDDWYAPGPEADDYWRAYEKNKGITYQEALQSWAATHIYEFDKYHLDRADGGILLMPAGKSGHIEMGYLCGQGKPVWVLFPEEPERWDVMYQFARGVYFNEDDLKAAIDKWYKEMM